VQVPLGSTSYISIVNSGRMDHVLHFHGFHAEVITSSYHPERVGWSKDTFPVLRGECLTVKLTAFQSGVYPVHNHNLIAVTNAGFYPGGQLTYIEVE
jgi:FtsP/CotA-like multicopper oxidase with cupredoxin domain